MSSVVSEIDTPRVKIMRYLKDAEEIPKIGPGVSIHFTGIGGIGMSALARICLDRGARVTGADNRENDQTRGLAAHGAVIRLGEHPELVEGAHLLVYSSAVSEEHSERIRARQFHIPSVRRGTLLARLTQGQKLLGVAGTHGKTTTTSMLAMALRAAGLDPTILVGGYLHAIEGNACAGADPYCVVETDESDGSFLELSPYLALVTNVEDDHLEFYGDIPSLQQAFVDYISRVENSSRRILCGDCRHLYALARRSFGQDFVTYGFSETCDVRGIEIHLEPGGSSCKVLRYGKPVGSLHIQLPGIHMLANAIGAFTAGLALGFPPDLLSTGLAQFRGTKRRFEILGKWRGATIIDDYGHHPTEIQATLRALGQYTEGRRVAVFQPHRYSRTDQLFDEFAQSFGGVDLLVISEIYAAGEEPRPGISSRQLMTRIQGVGRILYAPTLEDVEKVLESNIQPGDSVLFLGAGDINKVAYGLVARGE